MVRGKIVFLLDGIFVGLIFKMNEGVWYMCEFINCFWMDIVNIIFVNVVK